MAELSGNGLFSQVLLFVSQAGFGADVARAAGACAASWGDPDLWAILSKLSIAPPSSDTDRPTTALSCAAATDGGWTRAVWLLDHAHADVNLCDASGRTPLLRAVSRAHTPTTTVALLRRGADPAVVDPGGWSALQLALHEGHTATALLLLEHAEGATHELVGDDVDTQTTLFDLGCRLLEQGDGRAALLVIRAVADGRTRLLGADDPAVTDTLFTLARALEDVGSLAEAASIMRTVLFTRTATLGAGHASTLFALHNLARLLDLQGELSTSEVMFRLSVAGRTHTLGSAADATLDSMTDLALVLNRLDRADEAIALANKAMTKGAAALGAGHVTTLCAKQILGYLLATRKGEFGPAIDHLRTAYNGLKASQGKHHIDTIDTMTDLAFALAGRGTAPDVEEAEKLYRVALDALSLPQFASQRDIMLTARCLVELLEARGDAAAGASLRTRYGLK